MNRYRIIRIDGDSFDFEASGMPSWVDGVRAVWDRKVGGHGFICVQASGAHCRRDEFIDVIDGDESHDDKGAIASVLTGLVNRETGELPFEHRCVEDDRLPEFAGGRPSNYTALLELQNRLRDEMYIIDERIHEMCQRMRDHDFDGEFDPNAADKKKRSILDAQICALIEATGAMTDDSTNFEKAEREDAWNETVGDDSDDKYTRFCEGGWVDAGVYDPVDDRDD